jgi:hypothetical protein
MQILFTSLMTKTQQLAHEDLALACVVEDDAEADFFLRGLRESEEREEKAIARARAAA